MARFHVHLNVDGGGLLLDLQADLLNHLTTCVVAPLLPLESAPLPAKVLNPVFDIDGTRYMLATQYLATVPRRVLGRQVASLRDEAAVIVSAHDCLFQGV